MVKERTFTLLPTKKEPGERKG